MKFISKKIQKFKKMLVNFKKIEEMSQISQKIFDKKYQNFRIFFPKFLFRKMFLRKDFVFILCGEKIFILHVFRKLFF